MNTSLEHIILNVSNPKVSFPFYKDLFNYFEYEVIAHGLHPVSWIYGLSLAD